MTTAITLARLRDLRLGVFDVLVGINLPAAEPGVMKISCDVCVVGGGMAGAMKLFSPLFERSVEQGAATQCYVATSTALQGHSGLYFANCNPARMSAHGRDPRTVHYRRYDDAEAGWYRQDFSGALRSDRSAESMHQVVIGQSITQLQAFPSPP